MVCNYRMFHGGSLHHVYIKGLCGNVIFYSLYDYLFFLTLFFCLARRYGIKVVSICIMPNHIHSAVEAKDQTSFFGFFSHLESVFCREYNAWHHRKGSLFQSPFGFAPKMVGKKIRDNISYIANNPVVGKLSKDVLSYRWNLLSYYNCRYPFSKNIKSFALRKAKAMVNIWARENKPLKYSVLQNIFSKLNASEENCLTDYIISMYNIMDYEAMMSYYTGDFQKITSILNMVAGSEYDIPEDYEDYSFYILMANLSTKFGVDVMRCDFSTMGKIQSELLEAEFRRFKIPQRQIEKFFHRGR